MPRLKIRKQRMNNKYLRDTTTRVMLCVFMLNTEYAEGWNLSCKLNLKNSEMCVGFAEIIKKWLFTENDSICWPVREMLDEDVIVF